MIRYWASVPEKGLEPSRPCGHWILSSDAVSRKDQTNQELANDENAEVPVLVPKPDSAEISAPIGPALARVEAAWDDLPEAIKSAILTLVDAANMTSGGGRG